MCTPWCSWGWQRVCQLLPPTSPSSARCSPAAAAVLLQLLSWCTRPAKMLPETAYTPLTPSLPSFTPDSLNRLPVLLCSNVPAPSPAAERLCGLYHPVMVLLGLASVAYLLFGAERRQRLQLLARLQRRQRAERAAALARRRFRRPSSLASVPEEPTAAAAVAAAEQKQQHGLGQQERAKQPPLAVCGSKCSCGLELPALLEEGFETASVSGSEKDEASDEEEEGEVAEEGGVEALGGTSKGAEGFPLEVKQQAQQAAGQLGLPVAAFVLSLATAWFCC